MSPRESSTRPFHVSHEVAPGDQWSIQTPEICTTAWGNPYFAARTCVATRTRILLSEQARSAEA